MSKVKKNEIPINITKDEGGLWTAIIDGEKVYAEHLFTMIAYLND